MSASFSSGVSQVARWFARFEKPASSRQRRVFYWTVALFAVVVGVVQVLLFGSPAFVDDAYITIHNAEVLIFGSDVNYPTSSALTGATSAPHVVLVALLLPILGGEWACWTTCWLGAALYFLGTARLGFNLGLSWLENAALVFGALTFANSLYQLFNGLETSLALAAICWTLAWAVERTLRARRALAVLLGSLPFIRPELAALSALIFLYLLRETKQEANWQTAALRTAGLVPFALVSAGPWLVLYLVHTGSLLPGTISAKHAYFAEGCQPAAWKLATFGSILGRFWLQSGPWLAAVVLLLLRPLGAVALAFIGVFFAAYYVQFPGALGHYAHRYLYVLFPFLLLGTAFGLTSALSRVRLISSALLIATVVFGFIRLPLASETAARVMRLTRTELAPLAGFLNSRVPPDATLLIHDAGYVAHGTPFHLIDLVGLKTPKSAAWHAALTLPSCGAARGEALHRIALDSEAGYFVVLRGWDRIYRLTGSLAARGWAVSPLRLRKAGYDVFRIHPPAERKGIP